MFRVCCVAYASVPYESSRSMVIEEFNRTIDDDPFVLVGDIVIDSSSTGTIETSIHRQQHPEYPNLPRWLKNLSEFEAADRLNHSYSPSVLTMHDRRQCVPFCIE